MSKQITFPYNGKDYTLEFTRRSIRQMENAGFVGQEMAERPMTMLPALFAGAFRAHHKDVKQELIDEIYSHMTDKEKLIELLVDMYNEPLEALMDEPKNDEKKVTWTANW